MKYKRIVIAVIIVTLFGLTGVKVGALLPQTPVKITAPVPKVLLTPSIGDGLIQNSPDGKLLNRLNSRLQNNPEDYEARLLKGLLLFQTGDLSSAIAELQFLTHKAPKFQLAHLILGDLLLARFNQVDAFGAHAVTIDGIKSQSNNIEKLQHEAQARLHSYLSLDNNIKVPRALISIGSSIDYALVVDKSKNRLYVYQNIGSGLPPKLVEDFYIVRGKKEGDKFREGDLKTPVGVYFITSYLADEDLPPLYGSGAYPVNYPNEYDRNLHKTGSGIWLHGTDKSLYSRPPLDSEGCVVLTNHEFSRIAKYVKVGKTPIIIAESVDWISNSVWLEQNIEIQVALETWRKDWEQADLDAYLSNYASSFWSNMHNKASLRIYKRNIFANKTYQKIELSDISVLSYPKVAQEQSMVVANFIQHYKSNNFNGDMHKRLYLLKQSGGWKVVYEGRQ